MFFDIGHEVYIDVFIAKNMEQLWGPMTHYKNICHVDNFHLSSIMENKFMIFVAFQATYQGIIHGTIQWDLTGI